MKIHIHKLSLAGAIFSALSMIVLSIANALGIYQATVQSMQDWHMFYSPTVLGTVTGMIEAGVITYISIYAFVWIYQFLQSK